ncbi:hypothetical protein HNP84_004451 [Thermocatellispora tengchongensis]|uniref:Uncharacterized protein n=1 Tax=Thermocatellispora tengchongensis TaxID=1073253 RepID=A0A840PC11_9ACTN|nr:hypothetical protein [Thermocatellispora tengchongensis]MBB5134717.1 hypothetical protein [Thermocatellispora tengchongensis]
MIPLGAMTWLMDTVSASVSPFLEVERAAGVLARELAKSGVRADVHRAGRSALVSVWRGLVVQCVTVPDGAVHYVWWTGRTSHRTRRPVLATCPADRPNAAAARVLARYRELSTSATDIPAPPTAEPM